MGEDKNDQMKEGLDRLEQVKIDELSDGDLDSVAGGLEEGTRLEDVNCNSTWCCSNSSN